MNTTLLTVRELKSTDEWKIAFPIIKQLRADLNKLEYIKLLKIMSSEGYRMFALFENEEITSVIGITKKTNLYDGNHIFVYDLIVDENKISKEYDKKLLSYIENMAKKDNCKVIASTSRLQRIDLHRFYEEKMNYIKPSYS